MIELRDKILKRISKRIEELSKEKKEDSVLGLSVAHAIVKRAFEEEIVNQYNELVNQK